MCHPLVFLTSAPLLFFMWTLCCRHHTKFEGGLCCFYQWASHKTHAACARYVLPTFQFNLSQSEKEKKGKKKRKLQLVFSLLHLGAELFFHFFPMLIFPGETQNCAPALIFSYLSFISSIALFLSLLLCRGTPTVTKLVMNQQKYKNRVHMLNSADCSHLNYSMLKHYFLQGHHHLKQWKQFQLIYTSKP